MLNLSAKYNYFICTDNVNKTELFDEADNQDMSISSDEDDFDDE